jgi:arylformamidase
MSAAAMDEPIVFTPEFVERGYNNRAAVADHQVWLDQYPERSAATRARYRHMLDLRYGAGAKETLDLFLPQDPPRGTLVFIHGGYWRALDKSDFQFVAGPFLEQGIAVAVANYDLCPTVSIAKIVDQCRRMMVWLAKEGPRHGAPADQVVVSGHSAGGHLAAMMFATDWELLGLDREPFVGGVTLSGVHDLKPLVMASMNADLRLTNAEAARVSPVNHISLSQAPLLVAVGGAETSEFIRQSQLIWEAWPNNAHPAAGPLIVAGKHHFDVVVDYADPESELTKATLELFR